MRFNEWATFIKGSRDWCASKCRSAGYCLIEKCDDDDGNDDDDGSADKTEAMNLLWRASKCRSIDYRLIGRRGDDDNDDDSADKARAMSFLRRLWDESMRILLTSRISARRRVWEVMSDCACCMKEVVEEKDCLWFWMNFCNIRRLWLIWTRRKQI